MTSDPTRQNYDRLSRWYDLFTSSEKRFTNAGISLLDPKPGERILEIGSGTGHSLVLIARAGARVSSLDLSRGMLQKASRLIQQLAVVQAQFCQGNALALPYKDHIFNGIFLGFTLELFNNNDIPLVLTGCRRMLTSNGRLVVVSLVKEDGSAVKVYEWFHRKWPALVDCRPINLNHLLIDAGFRIQSTTRMTMWGLPVAISSAI